MLWRKHRQVNEGPGWQHLKELADKQSPLPLFQNKNTRAGVAVRHEPEPVIQITPNCLILARRCSQTIYPTGRGPNGKSSISGSSLCPVVSPVISGAWRQAGESASALTFTVSVAVRPARA